MVIEQKSSEFTGIYVAPEAAAYLTATLSQDIHIDRPVNPIHARNLIRWIRVGLMSPDIRNVRGQELTIGFEDLISMRVIAILRALGVSWHRIHKAEKWLRNETGHQRPFAIERVWTETVDVFAEFHNGFIAASRGGQLVFNEMVGMYLQSVHDMIFVPHNGVNVADSWLPHTDVIMNPRIQFGEPCIKGTRMRTRILWQMHNGGDSVSYLTRTFNLTEPQITHALEWEHRLRTVQTSTISR